MYPPRFSHVGDKMKNAERAFFEACATQLDDSWTVLYEVQWFGRRNQGNERGDADFLLMNSKSGIFCVEVKGGQQIFVKDNQWYSVPHGLTQAVKIRDPFVQAADSKSVLWSYLKEKIPGIQLSGALGHFVVFPGVSIKSDLSLSARKSLTCDRDSLKKLPETIAKISDVTGNRNLITDLQIEQIRKMIFPDFELISSATNHLDDAQNFIDELTVQQLEAFSMLNNWREFRILGGAGTGKTTLAFHRAKALASQGAKILFLCSSSTSAEYLCSLLDVEVQRDLTIESAENLLNQVLPTNADNSEVVFGTNNKTLKAITIHHFVTAYVEVPARDIPLQETFVDAAVISGLAFDGLIIDEGQNISLQTVELLTNLIPNRGTRYLYIFGDRKQNIFNIQKSALDFDTQNPELELIVNCRSTAEIVAAAECIFGPKKEIAGPIGIKPLVLFVKHDFQPRLRHELTDDSTEDLTTDFPRWKGVKEATSQFAAVGAMRYLVEEVGVEPKKIQHVVNSDFNMMHAFVKQYGLAIDTRKWTVDLETDDESFKKDLNADRILLSPKSLHEMVGLETDGLILEVEELSSYWTVRQRSWATKDYKEFIEQRHLYKKALLEKYLSIREELMKGKISGAPLSEVASESEVWTEILEGFKTTLYATLSRARLAVVIIGPAVELHLISEILGDRCEQLAFLEG